MILSLAKPPKNFAVFESHLRHGCQIWGQQESQHITGINDLH